jgi:hypothetical protein
MTLTHAQSHSARGYKEEVLPYSNEDSLDRNVLLDLTVVTILVS